MESTSLPYLNLNIETTNRPSMTASVTERWLSAYYERQKRREEVERLTEKAQKMLIDRDFRDRLYLFMSDLLRLAPGQQLDQLPHHGLYFSKDEAAKLSEYTCLYDLTKTPHEILASFEEIFASAKEDSEYLHWIRNEKKCIPGTLEGIHAKLMLEIRLEEAAHEEEERLKEEKAADARKKAAQRRKETRQKRLKLEQNGELPQSEECESTGSEDASSPADSNNRRETSVGR